MDQLPPSNIKLIWKLTYKSPQHNQFDSIVRLIRFRNNRIFICRSRRTQLSIAGPAMVVTIPDGTLLRELGYPFDCELCCGCGQDNSPNGRLSEPIRRLYISGSRLGFEFLARHPAGVSCGLIKQC